ncbi:sulfur carrier protein ThiS [Sinosporangium siamense]|uniref:Thiamine biosynthesis protein ThiS n=1 Tax=Sinosporangium siamense TaxID=1367973 RepID=A0A919V473_9ACTN|nr:sulfur carrier protein ThiS [Sinosporangium siamense]GII90243.1 thiamine biosynthesis protein ThiS [Sinosporangium siamense]
MNVTINGEARDVPAGATVADAVLSLTNATSGIAVAVNDEVIRRSAWEATELTEQDKIEVLTAVQGG